ncbi:aminoglycoside phosphotransferase family protein [Vibrio sp. T187]|uniref:aminoglycoside phosphotransferase family protein n=1 Tax=Vibrio TaxID=662 RepID=UPI0010C95A18|nr:MULTISPECIES: aminoglycoside phosphotransferase family protein [Vibrio]MBW3695672.1 aminoglycoside phosphotransferase family protein [Vibrio sp. T187]
MKSDEHEKSAELARPITIEQGTVVRPSGAYSRSVHLFLGFLNQSGLTCVPEFLGYDENNKEILSYVEGQTYNYPLSGDIASGQALESAAKLLRSIHDESVEFVQSHDVVNLEWMLPAQLPIEVMCHGDFTPYNVALQKEQVVGVFDFDTCHPGSRVWDVAFSVYCWAPFKTDPVDRLGNLKRQIVRAKLFCDAYGANATQRQQLVTVMIQRVQSLVDFMFTQAEAGNQVFRSHIEAGHHMAYQKDVEYLECNREKITQGLFDN